MQGLRSIHRLRSVQITQKNKRKFAKSAYSVKKPRYERDIRFSNINSLDCR